MSRIWVWEGERDPFPGTGGGKGGVESRGRRGMGVVAIRRDFGEGAALGTPGFRGRTEGPALPGFGGSGDLIALGLQCLRRESVSRGRWDKGGGGVSVPHRFGEGEQRVPCPELGTGSRYPEGL